MKKSEHYKTKVTWKKIRHGALLGGALWLQFSVQSVALISLAKHNSWRISTCFVVVLKNRLMILYSKSFFLINLYQHMLLDISVKHANFLCTSHYCEIKWKASCSQSHYFKSALDFPGILQKQRLYYKIFFWYLALICDLPDCHMTFHALLKKFECLIMKIRVGIERISAYKVAGRQKSLDLKGQRGTYHRVENRSLK